MTKPTNGLGLLLGTDSLLLNGSGARAQLRDALSDVTLNRTIEGASTLVLLVQDTHRAVLRSPLLRSRATLTFDGLTFELVKVEKQTDRLNLTFEASTVAALRRQKGVRSAAPGTTTRSQFAARLVAETHGVKFVGYPEPAKSRIALSRGTTEDTWTALSRMASDVGWRCFEVNGTIWFGPDSWFLAKPILGTIRENTGGIRNVDFDYDVGKPTGTVKVACDCSAWAFPPGAPVTLAGFGIADGVKLVQAVARSLYFTQANIDLTSPQPVIPAQ